MLLTCGTSLDGPRRDGQRLASRADPDVSEAIAGFLSSEGRGVFTHPSYLELEILADHLAGGDRSVTGRVTTYAIFTDPPLGRLGLRD